MTGAGSAAPRQHSGSCTSAAAGGRLAALRRSCPVAPDGADIDEKRFNMRANLAVERQRRLQNTHVIALGCFDDPKNIFLRAPSTRCSTLNVRSHGRSSRRH
ncbi:hypothetical protein XACJK4_910021 [Xanthomonas citri pv. citri]|nr:hypothetical protein XACJK4_910021 [Xanthomonas citri pv. citri]